jgi:hypothetical protein
MNTRLAARLLTALCLLEGALLDAAPGSQLQLTLRAGPLKRHETIVTVELAPGRARTARATDQTGTVFPLQIEADGHATFRVTDLDRDETRTLTVMDGSPAKTEGGGIEVHRSGHTLKISQDGQPVLEYQAEPGAFPRENISERYRRGGYLHPIFTPSGRVVTDDFPANHTHHHGVWSPWTHTEFEGRHPDFWNMGEGKGRVEFVEVAGSWSGPVHGGFHARHRFVDLTGAQPWPVLNESWEVRVYQVGPAANPYRMFDWTSTQTCAGNRPLILLEYLYGGLGFRGNGAWNGPGNESILTSSGETDRVKANMTRARWIHISGLVDGRVSGIAILSHPDNFRAPQPMRVHPSEPFFCFAPSQMGDFRIEPGHPYIARYRFIVADGPPDRTELDRLWNDYATPPEVVIGGR